MLTTWKNLTCYQIRPLILVEFLWHRKVAVRGRFKFQGEHCHNGTLQIKPCVMLTMWPKVYKKSRADVLIVTLWPCGMNGHPVNVKVSVWPSLQDVRRKQLSSAWTQCARVIMSQMLLTFLAYTSILHSCIQRCVWKNAATCICALLSCRCSVPPSDQRIHMWIGMNTSSATHALQRVTVTVLANMKEAWCPLNPP